MSLIPIVNICKPLLVGAIGVTSLTTGAIIGMQALPTPQEVIEPAEVIEPVVEELPLEATTVEAETPLPSAESTKSTESKSIEPTKSTESKSAEPILPNMRTYEQLEADTGNSYSNARPMGRYYMTQNEFETDFLGWCPQDVPEGLWTTKIGAGVSLGYLTNDVDIEDAFSLTDYIFSVMKTGINYYNPGDGFTYAHRVGIDTTGEDGVDKWIISITIDWPNRKIGWTRVDGGDNKLIGTRLINDLNELTTRMTSRLHQREAEFKAKCGY